MNIDCEAVRNVAGPIPTAWGTGMCVLNFETDGDRVRAVATIIAGGQATSHLRRYPGDWSQSRITAIAEEKARLNYGGTHRIVVRISDDATTRGWRQQQQFVELMKVFPSMSQDEAIRTTAAIVDDHPLRGQYVRLVSVSRDDETVGVVTADGEEWQVAVESLD